MFDTKIAIIVRDDLVSWQKLNVTAFLTSGIVAQAPGLIGEPYIDSTGAVFNPMVRQPMVVLSASQDTLRTICKRAIDREIRISTYIEEMFSTGHDAANRDVFAKFSLPEAAIVGAALHADKKLVDKITKGAKLHS